MESSAGLASLVSFAVVIQQPPALGICTLVFKHLVNHSLGTVCPKHTLLCSPGYQLPLLPDWFLPLRFSFSAPVLKWGEMGCCALAQEAVLAVSHPAPASWPRQTQLESHVHLSRGSAPSHPTPGPSCSPRWFVTSRLCPPGLTGLAFGNAGWHRRELLLHGGAAATSSCL